MIDGEAQLLLEPDREGLRDRVHLLRSLENFAGLDDDGLTLMAEHARRRRLRKGDVLTTEGEPIRAIYLVLEGEITVTRGGTVVVVERGRGVGLMPVLAQQQSGLAVASTEESIVLEIPIAAFLAALEDNFSLVRNLLRLLSGAILRRRGNLPANPDKPPPLVMGEYEERPRTLVERMIELRTRWGLDAMNIDALTDLARRTEEIHVEPGHVFWSVGDPSSHSLRIRYGKVRCTSGDDKVVDVGSNFVLGVMDSHNAQPRSYRACAESRVVAYRTQSEDFVTILENHHDVAMNLLKVIARVVQGTS
jgi:CRP-like cAMP-binding protein